MWREKGPDLMGWPFIRHLVDFTGNLDTPPLPPKPSGDFALMKRSSERGLLDFPENHLYTPYN